MENDLIIVAKAISERRKELKISQAQLAKQVNETLEIKTTQQHIANFEAGKVNLAIKTILAILQKLGLEIELIEF
jgi:transcriptional regulator with XRE-family HTH domain